MEVCQICHLESEDCRTLRLQYLCQLSEISDKLKQEEMTIEFADGRKRDSVFWTICTCKSCRGDFLELLRGWADGKALTVPPKYEQERCNPVRVDGQTVMMTDDEFEDHKRAILFAANNRGTK